MPTELGTVLTQVFTSTMSFIGSTITSYWGYLLGIGILMALAFKFRRTTRIVK